MNQGWHSCWRELISCAAALCLAVAPAAHADVYAWYELVDSSGPGDGVVNLEQGDVGAPLIITTDVEPGVYEFTIRLLVEVAPTESLQAYSVDLLAPDDDTIAATDLIYLASFGFEDPFLLGGGPGVIIDDAGQWGFMPLDGVFELFEFVLTVSEPPSTDIELFSGIGALGWASILGTPPTVIYADSDPLDEIGGVSSTPSIVIRQDASSGGIDCNLNGIPDDEEIAADPSLDCNENGVPDDCDLTDGTSPDCQGDGVPDECQLGLAGGTLLAEGFDDIAALIDDGWVIINNSDPLGTTDWFQGTAATFPAQTGDPTAYVAANFNNTGAGISATISNWLMMPQLTLQDGDVLKFHTRSTEGSNFPDRLEVRASLAGSSTDVGTTASSVGVFTILLLEVNPTQDLGGYPEDWTPFQVILDGIGSPTAGRLAFRYYVTDAGPSGLNSDYIGIDTLRFESGGTGFDCNDNGVPDECEPDCNDNGIADGCDIADGISADCNGNGIPDECEPDCNANGTADSCDIADGTSLDCNGNAVPDECDLADAASLDCNDNAVPDECDIADGTSRDCNGNAVPDKCDIADGTSRDCNGNAVPDGCDITDGTSRDCNKNGAPDACDIAGGTSQDCNDNAVPDGCDVADGTSQDCNNNGAPDACDIAGGTSQDCNGNGMPDDCDISDGNSQDCNGNGVPDECDLAAGLDQDCNANSIPDVCDLTNGISLDADGDGVPDECEAAPGDGPEPSLPDDRVVDRDIVRSILSFLFLVPADGRDTPASLPVKILGVFGIQMSIALTFLEWLNLPVRAFLFELFYALLDAILP